MSETFRAFADEMEKIAISEHHFLARAMNTIHKSPTARVPSQMARAIMAADRRGFTNAKGRILSLFKEWKEQGRHPGPAPKALEDLWREGAKAKKPKPAAKPAAAQPSAPKSWKQKALMGAAAVSVPAAAYGVHQYNKKKLAQR